MNRGPSAAGLVGECHIDHLGRVVLDGEHIGYLTLSRTGAWVATPVQGRDVIAASADRTEALQALLGDPCRPGRLF